MLLLSTLLIYKTTYILAKNQNVPDAKGSAFFFMLSALTMLLSKLKSCASQTFAQVILGRYPGCSVALFESTR